MRPLPPRLCIAAAVLFSLLVLLLGAQNAPEAPKTPVKDFSKATAYKIVRVIDGDTVVLQLDGKQTSGPPTSSGSSLRTPVNRRASGGDM
jgi:hypothetical protein